MEEHSIEFILCQHIVCFSLIISVSVHVCVCVPVCTCVGKCLAGWRDRRWMLSIFLDSSPPYFLWHGLSLNRELTCLTKDRDVPVLVSPKLWLELQAAFGAGALNPGPHILNSQHFTEWATSLSPLINWAKLPSLLCVCLYICMF